MTVVSNHELGTVQLSICLKGLGGIRQGDVLAFDNEHHQAQLLYRGLYGLHL
jgi:hypothetical protein